MKQLVHLIGDDGQRLCGRAAAPDSRWYGTDDPGDVTCGSCRLSLRSRARLSLVREEHRRQALGGEAL